MTAIDITLRDLGATFVRWQRACDDQAARTIPVVVKAGARIMVAEPWRLGRLLHDHDTRPLEVLLHECRVRIAGEVTRGREGHWTFDLNRLLALREAELALRFMRRFGE
jgi:hypothetical protein